jgi:hypothetical protein
MTLDMYPFISEEDTSSELLLQQNVSLYGSKNHDVDAQLLSVSSQLILYVHFSNKKMYNPFRPDSKHNFRYGVPRYAAALGVLSQFSDNFPYH